MDKQQIFLDNDKLIYLTLKKYFPHLYNDINVRQELYQIGAIGLLKAIDRYDSNLGAFSSYAVQCIWGEIKITIRDKRSHIHYSRKIIDIANKLYQQYSESMIEEELITWLTVQLDKLDISYNEKLAVRNYMLSPISLEKSLTADEDLTIADTIVDSKNILNDVSYNDYISRISNKLKDKENKVFFKFLNGEIQQDIADSVGLSQAQVSRIQKKIKIMIMKELYESGEYESIINILCDYVNKNCITYDDLNEICQKYNIDLSKCPKHILEKRIKNMSIFDEKIYSKKICQKLILKCTMKLILTDRILVNNENFKQSIKKLLIANDYNNESIIKHLELMNSSQIKSCIDFAKKNIEKYNYTHDYEIIINESDLESSKFIKKDYQSPIKRDKIKNESKQITDNSPTQTIISILECFKADNLMTKF